MLARARLSIRRAVELPARVRTAVLGPRTWRAAANEGILVAAPRALLSLARYSTNALFARATLAGTLASTIYLSTKPGNEVIAEAHLEPCEMCPSDKTEHETSGTVAIGNNHTATWSARTLASNAPLEDRYVVARSKTSGIVYFGVFDGHGGAHVSEFVMQKLVPVVDTIFNETNDVVKALEEGFVKTDRLLWDYVSENGSWKRGGSCAILAALKDGILYVSNSGDCRAVVIDKADGSAIPPPAQLVTLDHNAREDREVKKLQQEHPGEQDIVVCKNPHACYVKGRLQPTRAFGDFYLKRMDCAPSKMKTFTPPYITAHPETYQVDVKGLKQPCLVLATDGIWDECSTRMAATIMSGSPAKEAAELLLNQVVEKAAFHAGIPPIELKYMQGGRTRRRIIDDCTLVVADLF